MAKPASVSRSVINLIRLMILKGSQGKLFNEGKS